MIEKAAASDADLVFLDLEDSVAPAEKAAARTKAIQGLLELPWGRKTRAVRINALDTEYAYDDLGHVVEQAGGVLDVVIVPKIRTPEDVRWVDRTLGMLERRCGHQRPIAIEVLIEEVEAMANVEAIATSSPRLEALIFGPADYTVSQGVNLALAAEEYPDPWYYARNKVVIAARAAGIDAIDGPFGAFRDVEGCRRECRRSAALGFAGKWAIHPSQIDITNEVFSPMPEEVEAAQRKAAAYREAVAKGLGATTVDGVMIDAVEQRSIEVLLERAKLTGMSSAADLAADSK
jgi:citrate lyase subunit beta/citryl-CoA lyase